MQHTYSHPIVLIVCSGIAVYMAIKEMERYFDNHDTSSVAMKRFSKENDQDSQFPTFSICFHQGNVIYSSKACDTIFLVAGKVYIKQDINPTRADCQS